MRYEFTKTLVARVGGAVVVATALLMSGCAGSAPVAVTAPITSVPSSGSLAPAVVPPAPYVTSIAAPPPSSTAPTTTTPTVAP